MNKRIKVLSFSKFEMHILLKKKWGLILFSPIWLAGWTVGGFFAIIRILSNLNLFDAFFLIFWLLAEIFVLYAWLWNVCGKEIIKSVGNRIIIKNDIFGFGFANQYQISKISKLRASGFYGFADKFNFSRWNISGGTITFDYEGKSIRFGLLLDEEEAKEAVRILKKKLNIKAGS